MALYRERSQPQLNWAISLMQQLDWKGLSCLVDLGCREGRATREMARRYPESHVIGCDSAIQLLEEANENLAKEPLPNLEYRFVDLLSLDLQEGVDAIFSSSYLNWIDDKSRLLQAMRKSLKSSGKIALSFFAHPRFDSCIRDVTSYAKWQPYFEEIQSSHHEVQPHRFAEMLKEAGFGLKRLELVTTHDVFTTPIDFVEWLTTVTPQLQQLPEDLHEVFLADVTERHLQQFPLDERGHLHVYDDLLEVEAWKLP